MTAAANDAKPAPPATLDLGAHRYEIRTDADTARLLREENARGDSRPDRLLIRVDPDMPHTNVAETLLHEALHCIWRLTALHVIDGLADHEERVVTALAPLTLELLRRNPTLTAYLTTE